MYVCYTSTKFLSNKQPSVGLIVWVNKQIIYINIQTYQCIYLLNLLK